MYILKIHKKTNVVCAVQCIILEKGFIICVKQLCTESRNMLIEETAAKCVCP